MYVYTGNIVNVGFGNIVFSGKEEIYLLWFVQGLSNLSTIKWMNSVTSINEFCKV